VLPRLRRLWWVGASNNDLAQGLHTLKSGRGAVRPYLVWEGSWRNAPAHQQVGKLRPAVDNRART